NGGTLEVHRSTFFGNVAIGNATGGGIYNQGSLSLISSTISGNYAYFGGGLQNSYGSANVRNSTIVDNPERAEGEPGSDLQRQVGTVTVFSSIIGNVDGACFSE